MNRRKKELRCAGWGIVALCIGLCGALAHHIFMRSGALAEGEAGLAPVRRVQSAVLQFARDPIAMGYVALLPNGSILAEYYAENTVECHQECDDVQDLMLEILDALGESLWCKRYIAFEINAAHGYTQFAIHPDGFLLEYYDDLSLDTHDARIFDLNGASVSSIERICLNDSEKTYIDSVYPYRIERYQTRPLGIEKA